MKELKSAILMFIILTVICGGIYPAVVTVVAQAVFPKQANGSFITDKAGKPLPYHGGLFKTPDGITTTRHVRLGICQARDGSVYVLALQPYTLLRIYPAFIGIVCATAGLRVDVMNRQNGKVYIADKVFRLVQ